MSLPEPIPLHSSLTCSSEVRVRILPSLAEIQSEQILERIFTHNSLAVNHRYASQVPESDSSPNNEEWAFPYPSIL